MAQLKLRGIQQIYTLNESEAEMVKGIFSGSSYHPGHIIEIGQLSFKKSEIQLIQMEDNFSDNRKGINLSDPAKHEEVKKFEEEFNDFITSQPEEKRTFDHWLIEKRIISFSRPVKIAKSGLERFDPGSMVVHNTGLFTEYNQKYAAMNSMREYALRQLPPDLKAQKETMFESEEINISQIPF